MNRKISLTAVAAYAVLLFLYFPLLIIVFYSFSKDSVNTFPVRAYSLEWYRVMANDESLLAALRNSLGVAVMGTLVALVGRWASYEHYGVTPDLSTWAKALGSGMPIGCVIGRAEVMNAAAPGTIGGTYPGNPACCAAALSTLRYMEAVDINARGEAVGRVIRDRMEAMQGWCPAIGQVRGLGAMMAFELVKDGNPWQPDAGLATQLVNACAAAGLLIITAGTYGSVIRVLRPLVIEEDLLHRCLDILETQLRGLAGQVRCLLLQHSTFLFQHSSLTD